MEHAKKMIIIPQDMLQRMQHPPTSSDTVSELDSEMLNLLNNKNLGDRDKWERYQQVLQRYLHFTTQQRKPIHLPVIDTTDAGQRQNTLTSEEIIDTFPKTYKQDVRNILRAIEKRNDLVTWDSNGSVYIQGESIPKSNIVDLLHNIVRTRKSTQPPGWEQLMGVLKQINIPTEFITNPFSRQYLITARDGAHSANRLEEDPTIKSVKLETSPKARSVIPSYRTPSKVKTRVKKQLSEPASKKRPSLKKWEHFTP